MLRATVPRVELPRGSRFIRNSRAFSNILFSYTSTIINSSIYKILDRIEVEI